MPTVNFYLKKAEAVSKKSLIYLQFKYNGKRLVFSFGQSIKPGNWSSAKQRVKSNTATTTDGEHSLNDLLDNLATQCMKSYNQHMKNGVPDPETLKNALLDFMNQNDNPTTGPTLYSLIDRFISGEIKHRGKDKSSSTLRDYRETLQRLKVFSAEEKYRIDFDTITLDFYYKFVSFLKKGGLKPNSAGKQIKNIKTFMGEALDLKYTTNYEFRNKKFVVLREESDAVYLTEKEILKLFKHDFSKTKWLEKTRDLFCFGCWVGLRYSDYSNVKPENLVLIEGDYFLKIKTKKTGELVIIPCNPNVLEIFKKYKNNYNKLPKSYANPRFNKYIKKVCKEAGFNEVGRLSIDPSKELWQCISSHTARRSFATNYYLEGFPTIDLMKVTGHKTESAFMKYIKTTKLDTAKRLSEHIKKNWSGKLMKVAG